MVEEIMLSTHPHLRQVGVTVSCLFAYAPTHKETGEPKGPALKHHGYPALAVVKVNSQRDRAEGKADCTITFDGLGWVSWHEAKRRAVVDHEISHLELMLEDEDNSASVKLDESLRPRLKILPHDVEMGFFNRIVEWESINA